MRGAAFAITRLRREDMVRRLEPGQAIPSIALPRAGGGTFDAAGQLGRRWLLSFHRYAT
jgi:hypothetical protein